MRLSHARRGNGKTQYTVKKTNLSFVVDVHGEKKKGWTLENARKFVDCIQTQMVDNDYGGFRWDGKLVSKVTGMSEMSCRAFLTELRKAHEAGCSLEQMFRNNRPYRAGAKVLA